MNSVELQQGILNRLKGVGGLKEKASDASNEKNAAEKAKKVSEFVQSSLSTLGVKLEPGPFIDALNRSEYGITIRRITEFLIKVEGTNQSDLEKSPEYQSIMKELAQLVADIEQQIDEIHPKLVSMRRQEELIRLSGAPIDKKNNVAELEKKLNVLLALQNLFTFFFTAFASWMDLQELKQDLAKAKSAPPVAPAPDAHGGAHAAAAAAHGAAGEHGSVPPHGKGPGPEARQGREREPQGGRTLFEQALISNGFSAEICRDTEHTRMEEKYRLYESAFMGLFFKELWNESSRISLKMMTADHVSFSMIDKQGNDRKRKSSELVDSLISPVITGEEREFAEALVNKLKNGTFFVWDKLVQILPKVVAASNLNDLRKIHATDSATSGFLDSAALGSLGALDFKVPILHDGKIYFPDAHSSVYGDKLEKPDHEVAPFLDNREFKDIFFLAVKDMIARSIFTVGDDKKPFEPHFVNGVPQEYLDQTGVYSPRREDDFEEDRIFQTRIRSATVDLADKGFDANATPLAYTSDGRDIRGMSRKIAMKTVRYFNRHVRGAIFPYGLEKDSGDGPKLMDGSHGQAGLADVWRRLSPDAARVLPNMLPFGLGRDASGRTIRIRETKEEYYQRINNALLSSKKSKFQSVVTPQIAAALAGNFLYATLDAELQDGRTEFAKVDSQGNYIYKPDGTIDRALETNESSNVLQKILAMAESVWKYKNEGGRSGVGKTALITMKAGAISALRYFIVKNPNNNRVRTLEGHVLAGKKFDDVPWGSLPESATAKWVKQFQFYSDIVDAARKNFTNGDLRTLVKFDAKTGDINSANTKLVDELVDISRKLDAYANGEFEGFMSLDGVIGVKSDTTSPEKAVKYQDVLNSGEFVVLKLINKKNPRDVQLHFTRSQSFFHFQPSDFATYVDGRPGNKYFSNSEPMTINGENVTGPAIVIEVDPTDDGKLEKGYAKKVITRTQFARVVSVASAEGETRTKLEIQDYALFAIIFSAEARKKYAMRGFSNSFSQYAATVSISKFGRFLPRGTIEFLQKETPNLEGPDLYTMDQIFALFQSMGYKRTLGDLVRDSEEFGKLFLS